MTQVGIDSSASGQTAHRSVVFPMSLAEQTLPNGPTERTNCCVEISYGTGSKNHLWVPFISVLLGMLPRLWGEWIPGTIVKVIGRVPLGV